MEPLLVTDLQYELHEAETGGPQIQGYLTRPCLKEQRKGREEREGQKKVYNHWEENVLKKITSMRKQNQQRFGRINTV